MCSWTALYEAAATLVYYWRGSEQRRKFDDASESDEDEDEPVAAPRVHARDEPAEGLNEENGGRPRRRARTGG